MTIKTLALAAALGVLSATSSFAATLTLNVVGGQLLGAKNVDVNGTLYDVEFVDGSCVALFDGCDSVSDFAFTTAILAEAAAKSLMDTVFLDGPLGNFDDDPSLVGDFAITSQLQGFILIPYEIPSLGNVNTAGFRNTNEVVMDDQLFTLIPQLSEFSDFKASVYARFTPSQIAAVPLPAGGFLLLAGLAGLGAARMRRKIQATD